MDIIMEIWKYPIEITVALDLITIIDASTYAILYLSRNTNMHTMYT